MPDDINNKTIGAEDSPVYILDTCDGSPPPEQPTVPSSDANTPGYLLTG